MTTRAATRRSQAGRPLPRMAAGRGQGRTPHGSRLLTRTLLALIMGLLLVGGGGPTPTHATPPPNTWADAGVFFSGVSFPTATLLPNGTVLVAGGCGLLDQNGGCASWGPVNDAEIYDPQSGLWSQAASRMTVRRLGHTATLLATGRVLVTGGCNSSGSSVCTSVASTELYDPQTGTWTAAVSLSVPRAGQTATLLPSGKVLIAGGANNSYLSTAELYDPQSGQWTATGSMSQAREWHTATLLPSGRVLVAGGFGMTGTVTSAELYDPQTGSWSATGSPLDTLGGATATLLHTGRVLFVSALSAELYDPATGSWTRTPPTPPGGFGGSTATLLTDGQVLVAGGNSPASSTAELYDPLSGMWAQTGSMTVARADAAAVRLTDGRVLVMGGCCSFGVPSNGSELYTPGPGPLAVLSTNELFLGNVRLYTPGITQTFSIVNLGTLPLVVSSVTVTGTNSADVTTATPCLGVPIAPQGRCSIGVRLTPSTLGTRSPSLLITDNAPGSPQSVGTIGDGTYLSVAPQPAHAGAVITVTAGGFQPSPDGSLYPGEAISVALVNQQSSYSLGTHTTNVKGAIIFQATLPITATGFYLVQAVGQQSGIVARTVLRVTP